MLLLNWMKQERYYYFISSSGGVLGKCSMLVKEPTVSMAPFI